MPKITTKSGKVKHLPYTPKGMAVAKTAKRRGAKVTYKK